MKKYTDKELKAMTSEEREALLKQSTDEFDQLGKQIEDLLSPNPQSTTEIEEV